MRLSLLVRIALLTGILLLPGWMGVGLTQDKAKEKTPPPAPKKDIPKTNAEANKTDAGKKGDASGTEKKPSVDAGEESADEAAIRKGAEAFVASYNSHDAKAVAELFSLKAEITDEDGDLVKGREAIQQDFEKVFKSFPKSTIKIEISSIRVLTPNIAIEEGTLRGKGDPDGDENLSSYVAVHVKVDGRWMIASVKDYDALEEAASPTINDRLQDLAWMVGEWMDESPDTVVRTVCRWHDNGNFLIQEYQVQIDGVVAMSGTQRIGWDAVRKHFRSWVFDSKGGFSQGVWMQAGDEWIVRSEGSTAVGEAVSAINIYRLIDNDTIGYRSTNRMIDGERQDDVDEFIVKRRPPDPDSKK